VRDEEEAATRAEAAKAAIKAEKERLKRKRGELDALAEAVTSRKIKVDVDCDWRYSLGQEGGVKILVRRDTGQAVERRAVTPEERQLVIGERLEEANEEQLKIWEEQLAAQPAPEVVAEEEVEEEEPGDDNDESED
jgi:hypothetical protein